MEMERKGVRYASAPHKIDNNSVRNKIIIHARFARYAFALVIIFFIVGS